MALELEDLIKDKIYYAEYSDQKSVIIKCTKNGSFRSAPGLSFTKRYLQTNDWDSQLNIREATLEESQWLENCIKLNGYISLEESKKLHENTHELLATNAYGLKVGDKLDKKVINAWSEKNVNYYNTSWKQLTSHFQGNRTILSFKVLDGIVGFEVSGAAEIYLKAEGFKEFAENFNKPKFEINKWYKNYGTNYMKCKGFDDKYVYGSEYLGKNKIWEKGDFSWDIKTPQLLTDLSEIQEFLPLNHPDKQPNIQNVLNECKKRFPIGCKYKCANGNNDDVFEGSVNGVFEVKEYIIKENPHFGVHSGNGWLYINGKYAEIVSLLEEKKYDGINMEKQEEYKVGEYWFFKDSQNGQKKLYIIDDIIENRIIISSVNGDIIKQRYNKINFTNNINKSWIKALPHEIPTNKRKYHISEFTPESNLVIRCTNAEQGNKVASIFIGEPYNNSYNWYESKDFIVWKENSISHSWNKTEYLYPEQKVVEFEDVIFDNEKLTIRSNGDGLYNQIKEQPILINSKDLEKDWKKAIEGFKKYRMWTFDTSENLCNKVKIKNRTKKEEAIVQKRVKLKSNRKQFLNKTKNK